MTVRGTRPSRPIDSISELYHFTLSHYGVTALCPTLNHHRWPLVIQGFDTGGLLCLTGLASHQLYIQHRTGAHLLPHCTPARHFPATNAPQKCSTERGAGPAAALLRRIFLHHTTTAPAAPRLFRAPKGRLSSPRAPRPESRLSPPYAPRPESRLSPPRAPRPAPRHPLPPPAAPLLCALRRNRPPSLRQYAQNQYFC